MPDTPTKIAVIIGSTREGRYADVIAGWCHRRAERRADIELDVIDIAEIDLPPRFTRERTRALTDYLERLGADDAFVVITPEYNHSFNAALKNAIDFIGSEFANKPVAFASYSADKGVRAVEAWRLAFANFRAATVRATASFSLFTDFTEGKFTPQDVSAGTFGALLTDLLAWAEGFAVVREKLAD